MWNMSVRTFNLRKYSTKFSESIDGSLLRRNAVLIPEYFEGNVLKKEAVFFYETFVSTF